MGQELLAIPLHDSGRLTAPPSDLLILILPWSLGKVGYCLNCWIPHVSGLDYCFVLGFFGAPWCPHSPGRIISGPWCSRAAPGLPLGPWVWRHSPSWYASSLQTQGWHQKWLAKPFCQQIDFLSLPFLKNVCGEDKSSWLRIWVISWELGEFSELRTH